jgi:hypothetical protein
VSRFTVANILALIAVLAAGLAAMRDGSDLAARAAFTLMLGALLVGLLGAIVLRGEAAWVGFALFGWVYALATCVSPIKEEIRPRLLTTWLLDDFTERMHNIPPLPASAPLRVPTVQTGNRARKMVDGRWVTMTPAEAQMQADYLAKINHRWSRYHAKEAEINNSRQIGHLILSLIFALVGAVLGRILAARCRLGATPSASNPPAWTPSTPDR